MSKRFLLTSFITMLCILSACKNQVDQVSQVDELKAKSTIKSQPEIIPTGRALASPLDQSLVATMWNLVELNGDPFPKDITFTMKFTEEGLEGDTDCNDWSSIGDMVATSGDFSIQFIASSTVHCGKTVEYEKSFFEAIQNAEKYNVNNSLLMLQGASGNTLLIFDLIEDQN